jgi:FKBP-type peptidyl-prolyl cis-trans isomerase FkpA
MKNIYIALCFVVLATFLVACPKADTPTYTLRDRQEVYDENILEIENYLKSNYLTVDANMDATVTAIPDGGTQTSIWDQYKSSLFGNEVPYMTVKNDTRVSAFVDGAGLDVVDYKLYYIVLDEGTGHSPTQVDSTFTAYKGWNLSNVTFDQNSQGAWSSFPESSSAFISGYRQILSKIKTSPDVTGSTLNPNGTISWNNYGNVIVFIPSGLAYFNNVNTNIGQYAPICFQIKLYKRRERDHDGDRVKTKYEDINGNGNYFDDDTDGDNVPDFFDVDDDGDGTLTKTEITKPLTEASGESLYYPFDPILVDDPATTVNEIETKGIPDCTTPTPDYLTPTRIRKHLNATCN